VVGCLANGSWIRRNLWTVVSACYRPPRMASSALKWKSACPLPRAFELPLSCLRVSLESQVSKALSATVKVNT
jgi:hypothetical protein